MTPGVIVCVVAVLLGGGFLFYRWKGTEGLLGFLAAAGALLGAGSLLKRPSREPPESPPSAPPETPRKAEELITHRAEVERQTVEATTDPDELAARMRGQR